MLTCFVCGDEIKLPYWFRQTGPINKRFCCKNHIIKVWDDMEKEWVNASYDFDGAEEFKGAA